MERRPALIVCGVDIGAPVHQKPSDVHVTIYSSKVERGLSTIVCGVDVNATDYRGETPLHFAAVYGHVDIARPPARRGRQARRG